MKTLRLLPLLLALVVAGCSTPATTTGQRSTGKRLTVRTTAYTHTEPGGIKNAIGSRLKYGGGLYSAASDWSWLPLGTRFRMVENGRVYVIEDYGSALVGRKTIDLYMPNMREVNRWGVRHKEIEIIEWGSKAMSLKLLAPRSRNRHVAVMVAQLRRDGVQPPG
jgi:3D (Asp-Asp-Asp) domain-containing protein